MCDTLIITVDISISKQIVSARTLPFKYSNIEEDDNKNISTLHKADTDNVRTFKFDNEWIRFDILKIIIAQNRFASQ